MGFVGLYLLFLFLGFCLQAQFLNSQNFTCDPNDFRVLQDFSRSLGQGFELWGSLPPTNCCNLTGITCNSSRVVNLDLAGRKLFGHLPVSLGNLDQLRTLNLSHNFLEGTLPFGLLHLPKLEVLDLSNNDFHGNFPSSFSLPALKVLDITENSFNGSLPVGLCQNSTKVSVLKMALNFFNGVIPPGFGNCSFLEHICLASNYLTGELPDDLFRLPRLNMLTLQENQLSGKLSDHIGNLSNLSHLDISSNNFSGNLPDVFDQFKNFTYFSAQSNKFVGGIPRSLASSRTLASLGLRNNSLSGTIGLDCSALISLVSLDLATNRFVGSIPSNLSVCPKLRTINLARNNLTGEMPESFKNFQTLTDLSLSYTNISNFPAALRILQHCQNLSTLVLTRNFLGQELPTDNSLNFSSLRVLIVANCGLSGMIPQWLSTCKDLQLLDLSWNHLDGRIPSWVGDFRSLFYLDLSNNSFTGEIPRSLTGLRSLIDGNISLQEPSPDFPIFMKRNVSAGGLRYNQYLSLPPTLDLGNNFLNGSIWPEFGNLKELHVLDLKCNNLTGTIPSSLSGMTSVETLDLSNNNLNGTIPSSLVGCNFLSRFSVAYNNLSGLIPSGRQFATFTSASFEGNPFLCGEHSTPCSKNEDPRTQSESAGNKKRSKGAVIGMAVGIALGTVFLLALMFLIVLRASSKRVMDPEDETRAIDKDSEDFGSSMVIFFHNKGNSKEMTLDDLLKSTENFDQSNIVGCGGFGLVYKAILGDGRKVAIKKLTGDYGQMEREFQAEVEALSRAQHPNLVQLQGYCKFKNDRLLIYSYMENGSLDYWLHEKVDGPSFLDWETRLRIAQGSARGLAYLHQVCDPHILHRDIKSSNILLDENFDAHLADFGLARLILPYDTHVTTDVVGTLGYIPPEYGQASVATYKGDVYSFGVVLLELLTDKRPMDMCKPKANRDLISWVIQMKREKRETEVFDPFIYDKEHADEMLWVLEIACLCLNECPKIRPSTQQLVSWLDSIDSRKLKP